MTALFAGMNQMAAAGVAALLNTLWYAGAVVGLTWAILRYAPRVNAATRYWIWTGVLASLLVFPSLPSLAGHVRMMLERREQATPAIPLATVAAAPASVSEFEPVRLTLPASPGSQLWPLWLLAAWMFAAVWQLTRLAGGVRSVQRLKARAGSHGERLPSPWASQTHDEFKCGIRRGYQLLASSEVSSPVAVGYRHPAIILPPGLLERLDESEKRDVLLHELAHLTRHDDWLNLATRALGAILVLHPLAAIVMKQIEREREMACDDFVVAHTGSVRHYARSLARLHDLRWSTGTRLLAAGLLGQNSSLGDRIESLLRRGRKFSARASPGSLGVSALLLAALLCAGGVVPSWIVIAQASAGPSENGFSHAKSSPAQPREFEVASVRMVPNNGRGLTTFSPPQSEFFSARNASLKLLIEMAFSVDGRDIAGGPAWLGSQGYDVVAKPWGGSGGGVTYKRFMPPLRQLLQQRFHLKYHYEDKTSKGFELIVAKRGPKLQPSKGGRAYSYILPKGLRARNIGMPDLAFMLESPLRCPIIDKTGLKGKYDISINYAPGIETDSSLPSIFTAVQKDLGLKLEKSKVTVKVLVVDRVNRVPTQN
jgi:uncharacterized protein (TIGR03435 family)